MKNLIPTIAVALALVVPAGLRSEPDMSQFVRVTVSSADKLDTLQSKGKVAVTGAVKAPQYIEFRVGMSILDAVEAAGGFGRDAIQEEFQITNWETGTVVSYRGMKKGTDAWKNFYSRILLREGEVLHVVHWYF